MFGGIAARYDLMNRLMTVGLDGRWRRMAAAEARLAAGDQALDACCGTGDLSFSLAEACPGCEVTGLDFTPAMLVRARQKADGARAPRPSRAARVRRRRPARAAVRGRSRSPPSPSAGACATCPTSRAPSARWRGSRGRAGASCASSPRRRRTARASASTTSGWAASCRSGPDRHRRPVRLRVPSGVGGGVPACRRSSPSIMAAAGLVNVRYRRLGFGAVALHVGEVAG